MPSPWKQDVFYIYGIVPKVAGFTKGEHWNGFECPAFRFAAAWRIANALGGRYDGTRDVFLTPYSPDDPTVLDEWPAEQDPELGRVYRIGAFGWCWETADKWGES